jgi:DNA-binding PadR family transcriptional regulator
MTRGFEELGRFAEPSLYILVSLASGPRHGYAIMTDVEEISGTPMGPGTLYGALARLEKRGLIEALEPERRRPYRLTGRRDDARDPAQQPERLRRDRPRPDEARRAVSALIHLYPRAWRDRYGDEFLALLDARPPTLGDRLDIVRAALDARMHPQVRQPEAPEPARVDDAPDDTVVVRRLGYAALGGGVSWLLAWWFATVAAPLVYDGYGPHRDGSFALPCCSWRRSSWSGASSAT